MRYRYNKSNKGRTGAMNIITIIQNLMGQATPDPDVLMNVVAEVNKYLPDEDKFDLNNLPDTVSLFAVITLLPDASKYSLFTTQLDILPSNHVRRRHGKSVVKEGHAGIVLGLLATIIAALAMTSDGEKGADWYEVINDLIKILTYLSTFQ